MARYTGPIHKLCRREGISLCDSPKCPARGKRKYPPGQHGSKGYTRGHSIYNQQLRAKQRAKRLYGMLERQFLKFFQKARHLEGNTGDNLLKLLERRLDNVVYRTGLAGTRPQARQMVNHKHVLVNGLSVNIPSYTVELEDMISLSPQANKSAALGERVLLVAKKERPAWIAWDDAKQVAKVVAEPEISELQTMLEPSMIVELYSK